MQLTKKIQNGLLGWFSQEPVKAKSFSSIQLICKNLWNQHQGVEGEVSAYLEYFYPLLRSGVIEFYGNGLFALSPTAALFSDKIVVVLNLPENLILELNGKLFDLPGIIVVENTKATMGLLKNAGIPINKFDLRSCLREINLKNVVENWKEGLVLEQEKFEYFDWGWKKTNGIYKNGIYRRSSNIYSDKLFKTDQDQWKRIPSRGENPDGFNIALSYQFFLNGIQKNNVKYITQKSEIEINDIFFPIIIERLLFFSSLLRTDNDFQAERRSYYLENKNFLQLCRIFGPIIQQNE